MKGIILAGGNGTRLSPITKGISKQLLPIYDKPMIYYPLSVLMLAGIREILIISNPEYIDMYKRLLNDGSHLGLKIEYKIQEKPRGLADAFIVGEKFIGEDRVCLILGDNVFYGQGFGPKLKKASEIQKGAVIFGYYVTNPSEFGVVEFDEQGNVLSLEEKPSKPKSNYAIPGLYFYDNSVIEKAKNLKPSARGELEITDLNKVYLKEQQLRVELLGRGFAWLDTGTYDGLANAADFVRTIQKRTGLYIACLEEIAYRNRWITKAELIKLGKEHEKTEYGNYLIILAKEDDKK
ncbi:glucose-1-phosphate thymidylyltransferase [Petrotoga sp. HWH.PT.55.6.1]|uniref:glucose-1-phosphate thymidylyltransferase RfbA n=1 Tax=unclassified Petrotoga TaxID=2620614 RepID=UPI000CA00BFC|nr:MULTISPECIES: glucose-1-phosphate thymidylyltransferase RfbA [unclassified Petrotoga]PNR91986.1 glucose-1-phosphate thymidylyltransferase [Petrotoga sp. HWHPT.55.6.3]RPD35031.1 glucose-1-phosphate thymidylyltransferase [Petrotoga sp. HWH.PT.55.6.1]